MNSNNAPIKIFLTGATGYIGGSVLSKLLEPSHQGKYDITVLTRSEATISRFKELGVTPLIGTLDSAEILEQAAIGADVVMHFADSADHLPAAKAIVKGLNTGGKRRIYIHTSGTCVLEDNTKGQFSSERIYSDLDIEAIRALPVTNFHRDVDTYIDENNKSAELIVVCPPNIYGLGSGPFNRHSVQIPALIKGMIKAGKAITVGKNLNIWNNIHIDDLANFYVLLLEKALEGKASTGYDGWYFCESGEHVWRDVAAKIAEELYKNKVISDITLIEGTPEEIESIFGPLIGWKALGCNSRSKADRARQLGWEPSGRNPNVFETIEEEVKLILQNQKTN